MNVNPLLSPLLPTALVGTQRKALDWGLLTQPLTPLVDTLAQHTNSDATQLLRIAAAHTLAQRCGEQGTAATQTPEPAPLETLTPLTDNTIKEHWVLWCFKEGPTHLYSYILTQMAQHKLLVPPALLPTVLAVGKRNPKLRAALAITVGERGYWLAKQNAAWQYLTAHETVDTHTIEQQWPVASIEERQNLLHTLRVHDANAARELLQASFAELPAQDRVLLLGQLKQGIGLEDEATLTLWLKDRSKDVRSLVKQLLQLLPEAALTQAACKNLAQCMRVERALLRKKWVIEPPAELSPDILATGIEAQKPKQESLGERAWWLYQMASQVPLQWWEQHTALSPEELLAWASEGDWAQSLQRAWLDVLLFAPCDTWGLALLMHWPKTLHVNYQTNVLKQLSHAARETYLHHQLSQKQLPLHEIITLASNSLPASHTLTLPLSTEIAKQLSHALKKDDWINNYQIRHDIEFIAAILHVDTLRLLQNIPRHSDESPAASKLLEYMTQTIAVRLAFDTLFSNPALTH